MSKCKWCKCEATCVTEHRHGTGVTVYETCHTHKPGHNAGAQRANPRHIYDAIGRWGQALRHIAGM